MADREHVKTVQRGRKAIEEWRKGNPGSRLDLREADLRGTGLSQVNLREADLRGANLRGASLFETDLSGADLRKADLRGANLFMANLANAALGGTDFRGAHLFEAVLSGADLSGADLRRANLSGADLRKADLGGAKLLVTDLWGADLGEASLRGADLRKAHLIRADLNRADLSEAVLSGANLCEANLSEAVLRDAYLSEADLSGADLSGADLSQASLVRTRLIRTNLTGALVNGCDVTEIQIEKLTGLPNTPSMLFRRGHELTGSNAANVFVTQAIVEVYLTTSLTDETLAAYYLHLGEMRKKRVGTKVCLRGHRDEAGGSVLEFQAPNLEAILDVLPDLLATFPRYNTIDWQRSSTPTTQENLDDFQSMLAELEKQTPQRAWPFAERLARAFPGFVYAGVAKIETHGNHGGARNELVVEIVMDEEEPSVLQQRISPTPLFFVANRGGVQMIEDEPDAFGGEAGGTGPDGQSHRNVFQQIWDQSQDNFDVAELAKELAELRDTLKERATEAKHYVAVAEVAQAQEAAQSGDGPKALQHLNKAGRWAFDGAAKLGLDTTTAAARALLDLQRALLGDTPPTDEHTAFGRAWSWRRRLEDPFFEE